MTTLPEQWCLARVRDLIDVDPRNDCPDDLRIGFVPLARLGVLYRSSPSFETKTWAEVKKGYTHFADGDVLLARITPSFENGKAGIPRGLPNGLGAGSTEYVVCRPRSGSLLPEYLLAHFKTPAFLEEGARVMTGAVGHQRVPKKYILDSRIPLAPINEQRRIVDKLNSALARVDTCRALLDRLGAVFEDFRHSVLTAAISGDLTTRCRRTDVVDAHTLLEAARASHREFASHITGESKAPVGKTKKRRRHSLPKPADVISRRTLPDNWAWASGAELVEPGAEIVYGINQPGARLKHGIPYIRGADIRDGKILANQLLRTSHDIAGRHSRSSLAGGDVLLGIIRSTKVAIVPDALAGANITQGTARFRPSSIIRTKYLAIALEAPPTQAWLHQRYRGIDMPGLNLADVRQVPIPLPPLSEQDAIVRRVDSLLAARRRVVDAHGRAYASLQRLAPSFLTMAFRGDLVSQDPKDAPASELLTDPRATGTTQIAATRRTRTTRKVTMSQVTPDLLRQVIDELPSSKFTFAQLRERVPGDYESLRDALFALLGGSNPPIRQLFDVTSKTMILERIQQ